MKGKKTNNETKKMVKNTVNELKKIKGVKAIYVFGSYVKGTYLPYSDVDICVITKKNMLEDTKIDIVSNSSEKMDIVIFWDLPIFIRYRVLREGNVLFVQDKTFLHSTIVNTIREYFDFMPVIKRFSDVYLGESKWIEKEL